MTRKTLLAKIRALLAKTVANGCTESEAMAALGKARAMMAEYEIGHADLDVEGEGVKKLSRAMSDRDRIRDRLCMAVGRFTQCRVWTGPGFEEISFCGLESDTVFADWLLDTLAAFVGCELIAYLTRTWRAGMPTVRRRESEAFVTGCCDRISARLHELATRTMPASSRALVVTKDTLIDAKMAALGIHLSRGHGRFRFLDGAAHGAGAASGESARFDRPIRDRDARPAIGRRQ